MNSAKLLLEQHAIKSAPGSRLRGRLLREAILSGVGLMCEEGLARFLRASLTQPCCAATYWALADQPLEALMKEPVLELQIPGKNYAAPICNFARGLSRDVLNSYREYTQGKSCLHLIILGGERDQSMSAAPP